MNNSEHTKFRKWTKEELDQYFEKKYNIPSSGGSFRRWLRVDELLHSYEIYYLLPKELYKFSSKITVNRKRLESLYRKIENTLFDIYKNLDFLFPENITKNKQKTPKERNKEKRLYFYEKFGENIKTIYDALDVHLFWLRGLEIYIYKDKIFLSFDSSKANTTRGRPNDPFNVFLVDLSSKFWIEPGRTTRFTKKGEAIDKLYFNENDLVEFLFWMREHSYKIPEFERILGSNNSNYTRPFQDVKIKILNKLQKALIIPKKIIGKEGNKKWVYTSPDPRHQDFSHFSKFSLELRRLFSRESLMKKKNGKFFHPIEIISTLNNSKKFKKA